MEERIAAYLRHQVPDCRGVRVEALRRIPGGASRETWSFDALWDEDGGERRQGYILRRDPDASLLETDRWREYAIYRALEGTDIPVPRALWLEAEPAWLDRPFFLMERVDNCFSSPQVLVDPRMARIQPRVAEQKMAILARIHRLDWQKRNLAALGTPSTPSGCATRELEYWTGLLAREAVEPQPVLQAAVTWLRRNLPPPAHQVVLVHGDYRTGNFLFDRRGEIRGILDWEMAHLGDPMEDLAWLSLRLWRYARDERLGGLLDRDEAYRMYEEAGGFPVNRGAVHWWEVLGNLKMAVICLTGGRSFVEGRTGEVMMALVARMTPRLEMEILDLLEKT